MRDRQQARRKQSSTLIEYAERTLQDIAEEARRVLPGSVARGRCCVKRSDALCYRHPSRETGVACSNCGRPICPDCMTPTSVGMRCPECAGERTKVGACAAAARPQLRRRQV